MIYWFHSKMKEGCRMNSRWLDAPEKTHVVSAATYFVLSYLSLPTFLSMLGIGLEPDLNVASWFEIVFHVINFLLIGYIFRQYLSESLINAQVNKEQMITTVATAVGAMLGVGILWFLCFFLTGGVYFFELAAIGTLPLTGIDLFALSSDVVLGNKIFGTLCVVLLTPITTSCLYYAIGFVPAYNVKPWLGYAVMALVVAFPRACNAIQWGNPTMELMLYLAQLPIHMIGCWAYKKVDTIWAPIVSIVIANVISSLVLIIFF